MLPSARVDVVRGLEMHVRAGSGSSLAWTLRPMHYPKDILSVAICIGLTFSRSQGMFETLQDADIERVIFYLRPE